MASNLIHYEQPINEKMRTLLRLEFLFANARVMIEGATPWTSRAALLTVLDIQSILARTDIKTDMLKELERLSSLLDTWSQRPGVDGEKLGMLLDRIDLLIDRLHSISGPLCNELKQNELLNAVRQRASIPGGACDFDMPSYHFWLSQPRERRIFDLRSWIATVQVVDDVTNLVLSLVRDSSPTTQEIASNGFFQQTLDPNQPYQMVRVSVAADCPFYAEISGGKHRFSVRFLTLKLTERDTPTLESVPFGLTCCAL